MANVAERSAARAHRSDRVAFGHYQLAGSLEFYEQVGYTKDQPMNETDQRKRILYNWQQVSAKVADAATKCGRSMADVQVIGVTKYVDAAKTRMLVDAGCTTLGENRPQALWQKAESESLADQVIDWHMIGHLQRNKLRRLLRYRPLIHSVDSERLLESIVAQSGKMEGESQSLEILLEVNISGDESKTGLTAEAIARLIAQHDCSSVQIRGLMAMAGWGTDADQAQRQFAAVRELRDRISTETGQNLPHLSMGMSGDFEAAIAEGATMVRIGSSLFAGVLDK